MALSMDVVRQCDVPISGAVASKRECEVNKLQSKPLDEVIAALPCPVFAAFGARSRTRCAFAAL
jgi:hypothetical protein